MLIPNSFGPEPSSLTFHESAPCIRQYKKGLFRHLFSELTNSAQPGKHLFMQRDAQLKPAVTGLNMDLGPIPRITPFTATLMGNSSTAS